MSTIKLYGMHTKSPTIAQKHDPHLGHIKALFHSVLSVNYTKTRTIDIKGEKRINMMRVSQ